jgi:hypothetical protein
VSSLTVAAAFHVPGYWPDRPPISTSGENVTACATYTPVTGITTLSQSRKAFLGLSRATVYFDALPTPRR